MKRSKVSFIDFVNGVQTNMDSATEYSKMSAASCSGRCFVFCSSDGATDHVSDPDCATEHVRLGVRDGPCP